MKSCGFTSRWLVPETKVHHIPLPALVALVIVGRSTGARATLPASWSCTPGTSFPCSSCSPSSTSTATPRSPPQRTHSTASSSVTTPSAWGRTNLRRLVGSGVFLAFFETFVWAIAPSFLQTRPGVVSEQAGGNTSASALAIILRHGPPAAKPSS